MHQLIKVIRDKIRGHFDAAKLIEERMVALDIKAQKLRGMGAMHFFESYAKLKKEAKRLEIPWGKFCQDEFGCGEKHLRKLRTLHQLFGTYCTKRQAYAAEGGKRFGLRLAFELVGIPTGTNAHAVDAKNGVGTNGDSDEEATPQWLIDLLDRLLRGFTLDPAASVTNTKVPGNFFDKRKNGLVQEWGPRERIWLNPPFSSILPWLRKTIESDVELVVALLPPHFSSGWWRQCVDPYATLVMTLPRLKFGDHEQTAREDVVLVLYARNAPWALDALAPHLAHDVSAVRYAGNKRIGAFQMAQLLREPRAIEVTPDKDPAQRDDDSMPPASRNWLSPPRLTDLLDYIFPGGWTDMCPYPLPKGFDALARKRWPPHKPWSLNPPFRAEDELHGHGLTAFADMLAEQHQLSGTSGAMVVPVTDVVSRLLMAGAIAIPLGRVPFLDVETREPAQHPGTAALFVLPGEDFDRSKLEQLRRQAGKTHKVKQQSAKEQTDNREDCNAETPKQQSHVVVPFPRDPIR